MNLAIILNRAAALCALSLSVFAQAGNASNHGADSLETLKVIISAEMKPGNRVLRLQDGALSDSLMRQGGGLGRERFNDLMGDSTVARELKNREEFRRYWARVQENNGHGALKRQFEGQDIDRSRIPKMYLFDSSVVVLPGWVILRKRNPPPRNVSGRP